MAGEINQPPPGIDYLSYNPMHDYRTVDVDAWAQQWFSGFASLDPDSEDYLNAEHIMHRQLKLHPNYRDSDARDLEFGMFVLRSVGSRNPHNQESDSDNERLQYQQWEQQAGILRLIARQIVRVTLEEAEDYAAFRMERERSGTDYLTGVLNRRGLARRLHDLYGITDDPVRRDPSGEPLPPVKLTHFYNDANRFRWINNALGHQVGDAAIVEMSWRGRDFFRQAEGVILYREGGDEFGGILAGLDDEEVGQITRRLMIRLIERVASPEFREALAVVEGRLQEVKESGQRVRAEARLRGPAYANRVRDKRPDYELYINGAYVTDLSRIISISSGVATGMVSSLADVERLRHDSEAHMGRVKQVLRSIIEGEIIVVGDTG